MKRYPPIVSDFPHMIHGSDYNPEQWMKWKDTIWKEDMRLGKLAHMNSLSVGIFSWAKLEPKEGEFDFAWMDEVMDNLHKNGMKAVLATPSGARPAWLSQRYPEVLRVRADGRRNLHGGRHNHCLTSPVYREKLEIINTKLAERYKDHPALGVWHISNEYSGECFCEQCQEKFREYVKEQYKTLDAVNEAWWTTFWSHTYSDWSQIEAPCPTGEMNTHGLTLAWRRFTTEQFVDFYLHEIKPLKRVTPDVPCTANLMAGYAGMNYKRFAEVLDVVSWDNYPRWTGEGDKDTEVARNTGFNHALMYGLKQKPFLLMESSPSATNWTPVCKLRRPGVHKLHSIQAVAHGSDSVQYFQMRKSRGSCEKLHGAVIDHEGTENTRVFREVADTGAVLETLDHIVGTTSPAKVAVIHDYENRWIIGDIKGMLQDKSDYIGTVMKHYGAFWEMGVPVDVIDETQDFSGYDVLVAPMMYMLRGDIARRVDAFVKNGGTFVATYMTGYADENDLTFLGGFPGPLKETLGIWNEEIDALYPEDRNAIEWNGKSYEAFDLCEIIHLRGAKALGTYGQDFYGGMPAVTVNECGKGRAYYIAARTDMDFLCDFYTDVLKEAGVKPLCAKKPPKGVSVQARTDGEKTYAFLMNFTPERQSVDCGANGVVTLPGYGIEIIEVKQG